MWDDEETAKLIDKVETGARRLAIRRIWGSGGMVFLLWFFGIVGPRLRLSPIPKDCHGRLAAIDDAITRWAVRGDQHTTNVPSAIAVVWHLGRAVPGCPDRGDYRFGSRALATTCSLHGIAEIAPRRGFNPIQPYIGLSHFLGITKPPRPTASKTSWIADLKQIHGAELQWALENRITNGAPLELAPMVHYCKGTNLPVCPRAGKYFLGRMGDLPICTVSGHRID
jgi:hypothetical protein